MATLNVKTRFTLNLPDGTKAEFQPGVQDVDDAIVDHWYVQANSELVPDKKSGRRGKNAADGEQVESPATDSQSDDPPVAIEQTPEA